MFGEEQFVLSVFAQVLFCFQGHIKAAGYPAIASTSWRKRQEYKGQNEWSSQLGQASLKNFPCGYNDFYLLTSF